jgi:predicted Zn-dependent protease
MSMSVVPETDEMTQLDRLDAPLAEARPPNHDEAIGRAAASLCHAITDLTLLHFLGVAFHESGDLPAATHILGMVLARDPGFVVSRIELGAVHMAAGRRDDARRSYEISVMSPDAPAYVSARLAEMLAQEGQFFQARLMLKAALVDQPNHPDWQRDLARIERQLLQRLI